VDDLFITPSHTIPARELIWRFDTSGGPGGQHANRSATRVELRYDLAGSDVFEPDLRARMLAKVAPRYRDGVVVVIVDDTRSQYRNRVTAQRRLKETLIDAMQVPKERRPTRPSGSVRRRRMQAKQRRSEIKRMRRKPDAE
jgi:ribosome-associated protein